MRPNAGSCSPSFSSSRPASLISSSGAAAGGGGWHRSALSTTTPPTPPPPGGTPEPQPPRRAIPVKSTFPDRSWICGANPSLNRYRLRDGVHRQRPPQGWDRRGLRSPTAPKRGSPTTGDSGERSRSYGDTPRPPTPHLSAWRQYTARGMFFLS